MKNKAQQEMVGFVLIVALVMVSLMVFLIISLRQSPTESSSVEAGNLLNALMKQTTTCAIVFVPQYDSFEDLFKSCYNEDTCENLNKEACEYLDTSLKDPLDNFMETEATISAYELEFILRGEDKSETGILKVQDGECLGQKISAQKIIISGSDRLVVRIKLCKD